MSRAFVTLILSSFLFLACGRSDQVIRDFKFKSGQKFTYLFQFELIHENGDTLYNDESTVVLEVTSTNASIDIWNNLIEFKVYEEKTPLFYSSYWYQQTKNALYDVAYRNPGYTPFVQPKIIGPFQIDPKSIVLPAYSVNKRAKEFSADSIIIRDEIRLIAPLPLYRKRNLNWTEFSDPFLRTSKVVSDSTINIDGKNFFTYNISSTLPEFNDELEVNSFLSKYGLIFRTVRSKQIFRDVDHQEGNGYVFGLETVKLINFTLN